MYVIYALEKVKVKSKPTAQRHWETNKQSLFMKCGGVKNSICSFKWSLLTIVLQMLPWSFRNICWPSNTNKWVIGNSLIATIDI